MDFPNGSLLITEASTRKRASLYIVAGRDGLTDHDRGGVEPLAISAEEFTYQQFNQIKDLLIKPCYRNNFTKRKTRQKNNIIM